MNVCGRNPTSRFGKSFGLSFEGWSGIHWLIVNLCSDLLDEATLRGMTFNDGHGPLDQETCTEMAGRFERWMDENPGGQELDFSKPRPTEAGESVREASAEADPDAVAGTPCRIEEECLEDWIDFLRHCGGFEVW
jgi:hypothetical protein